MENLAFSDELTGISNRRFGLQLMEHEFSRFQGKHSHPFWVTIVDIDFFKKINDQFGHDVGDRVLQRMGQILKTSIRDSDWVARWGGEEFVILMVHVSDEISPLPVVERIRKAIESYREEGLPPFTASFGIAQISEADQCVNDLLKRADEGLYRAKAEGRNRVILSDKRSP